MLPTKKLSTLCYINSGGTPSRGIAEYYGGSIPWAKISDIEKSEGVIYETDECISDEGLKSIGGKLFPVNTLLFSMYGSVGKVAFSGVQMASNQAILGIRPNEIGLKELDLTYLFYWFKVNIRFLKSRAVGGILKNLSATIVKNLEIPLPSLEDQKRIAKVLSACDRLIQKRKESISLLEELIRSTFLELFWINNPNYNSWERNSIENYALLKKGSMRTGPFGSSLLHSEFSETGPVKVLGIDNVVTDTFEIGKPRFISLEKYQKLKMYRVFPDDVLISIMGTNGRSAVVPKDIPLSINTKHLAAISLDQDKILPYYLKYSFQYHPLILSQLSKNMKGAIMSGLNLTIIKKLNLPKPPLDLQEKFNLFVQKHEEIKNQMKGSLDELENLYGSLSQRAFRGVLDLSNVDISEVEDTRQINPDWEHDKSDLSDEEMHKMIESFEHVLPKGDIPSERNIDIRNLNIRQYLGYPKDIQSEVDQFIEFSHMDKDFFYQFILKEGFSDRTFKLSQLEEYSKKYILRGTGFEFTYENWKEIIFRFLGAKKPLLEQIFDEKEKSIKLKLTDEAYKA